MSWEKRGSTASYYYRKERTADGRVRSRYVGRGALAECVAQLDGVARALARYRVAGVHRVEATLDGAGHAVETLTTAVRARLGVYMKSEGYRYHRGEWRRPRGGACAGALTNRQCDPDRGRPGVLPVALGVPEVGTDSPTGIQEPYEEDANESSPRAEVSDLSPLSHVPALTNYAHSTRLFIERALLDGKGDPTHPTLLAFGAAAGTLAGDWGDRRSLPTGDAVYEVSRLERRRLRGRIALGRRSALGPYNGSATEAALAVAVVLDEVGVDGRAALAAAVEAARSRMEWDASSMLGRAVIDQLALAQAHADLVHAFEVASVSTRSAARREFDADVLTNLDAVAEALGPFGDAVRSALRDESRSGVSSETAWRRRARRTRRRLADAERLLRHAKKGGLVSVSSDDGCQRLSAGVGTADDPLRALNAPAPLDPLRGEAAEAAERMGRHVEAMRASWPPPERIRASDLFAAESPWNWFSYELDSDDEGEDAWWVLRGEHETPDEVAAGLATWAPEYSPLIGSIPPPLGGAHAPDGSGNESDREPSRVTSGI